MLTKLTVRNFKTFEEAIIDLGASVVFVGPNNCGKTSALQALALWDVGLKRWIEKRSGKVTPEKRPGVTINPRDLSAIPVPQANLLWRNLHVRDMQKRNGKTAQTKNVRIDVIVEGVSDEQEWQCGLEFDYANPESFYCRPLRLQDGKSPERMAIPDAAEDVRIAFLLPMSGLADREFTKQIGEIEYLLGQGKTAEVLRNMCYQLMTRDGGREAWKRICGLIQNLFGVQLDEPDYIADRSEITMAYREHDVRLDISSAGRGLHQTLLLLAFLAHNPHSVLLIDEPDAHLEILRQRQIYESLTDTARQQGSQIVIATHSEVILNEAAGRDVVVAFLGKPHRIDDRGSQVLKALKEIGFEEYYQAEQTGWVLYLEGSTDLAILKAFAKKLGHPAQDVLQLPFVHYIGNQPSKARDHFRGLREAKVDLVAFTLCDRREQDPESTADYVEYWWKRKEIENYLCQPETLAAYVEASGKEWVAGPLFEQASKQRRAQVMRKCIEDLIPPVALKDRQDRYWYETKASDDFLDLLFQRFFRQIGLPNLMSKSDYHVLAHFVAREELDPEIKGVLDMIVEVAGRATPVH